MMAPYAIGHMKMAFTLEELGYKMKDDERFKLYLTNALEMEDLEQTTLPVISRLSEESHQAGAIKKEQPILVIMGNPPYSVSSSNKSAFIEKEMELYKEDVRPEKNIQPLSDDYIKFIRFAHWKIDKAGQGCIGMITNNSYLSGLIHRGMRKKLLDSFDQIYILNLHGNSRIGEQSPNGSKDENVFEIKQGVSISLFFKENIPDKSTKLNYFDLFGNRLHKYSYLDSNNIKTTIWKELCQKPPNNFFIFKDMTGFAKYSKFQSVTDIFSAFSSGVKTHRDHFLIGFTKEELINRIRLFKSNLSYEYIVQTLKLKDTRDWKINIAKEKLKELEFEKYIIKYNYRPYDNRYCCYIPALIDRGCDRWNLMYNFFKPNMGLTTIRSEPITTYFSHAFTNTLITDIHYCGGQTYVFPTYIYNDTSKKQLFDEYNSMEKETNINPRFTQILNESFKEIVSPELVLYYIYSMLHSNHYRKQYLEFLKIDFPRIPFTRNHELFKKAASLGKRLFDLHLLQSPELDPPLVKYPIEGDNKITKIQYKNYRVYINGSQYFEGITPKIWEYQIGGYQVIRKWLSYRKGRVLNSEDIKHICKTATALSKTIEIQKEIDLIYPEIESDIIEFI